MEVGPVSTNVKDHHVHVLLPGEVGGAKGVHLPALLERPAILEHGLSASAEIGRLGGRAVWVSAFKAAFPLFPHRPALQSRGQLWSLSSIQIIISTQLATTESGGF